MYKRDDREGKLHGPRQEFAKSTLQMRTSAAVRAAVRAAVLAAVLAAVHVCTVGVRESCASISSYVSRFYSHAISKCAQSCSSISVFRVRALLIHKSAKQTSREVLIYKCASRFCSHAILKCALGDSQSRELLKYLE